MLDMVSVFNQLAPLLSIVLYSVRERTMKSCV